MPSKKKQSRTPSGLSTPDHSASPRTPSLTSVQDTEATEEEFRCSLEEASSHFPSLIGKSAIIARVADAVSESRGLKIWLSETSMVSASVAPGSTVSVSLAPLERRLSNNFPLSSASSEYGLDSDTGDIRESGDYFVLAKVFPSSKVLKNNVRFSLNLHHGLGCPASGRVVFVYPVRNHFLADTVNGRDVLPNADRSHLSLHVCKEMYLELTPFKNILGSNSSSLLAKKLSAENSHNTFENGHSTPVTPLNMQKLSSHNFNVSASETREGSVSNIAKQKSLSINLYDLGEGLSNESAKRLLQDCVTSRFNSCSLLLGNLVALPILLEMRVFRIKGANKFSADASGQDLNPNGQTVDLQAPEPLDHAENAFIINQVTKVYLLQPSTIASEIPEGKVLPPLQLDHESIEDNVECEFSKLGGLSKEFAILKDIIISSYMKNTLSSLGLRTTKGVLLHGPPGTGKTSLARLCARDSGVNFFSVNGPEIVSQYFGESEQALHEVFSSASKAAPAVVFIDELDAIAPERKDGSEELSQRMVATLLNLMDGISRSDGVLVIAATNRPDSIEPALRRPGRLDREIEIGVPSPAQRLDILQTILGGMEHLLSDMHVQQLAMTTHGFVGSDLAALCNEAALICLRRHTERRSSSIQLYSEDISVAASLLKGSDFSKDLRDCSDSASSCVTDLHVPSGSQPSFNLDEAILQVTDDIPSGGSCSSKLMLMGDEECTLRIVYEDFESAKMKIRPSAMREVILEVPKVNWEDVGGQKEVKNQLMEAVEWPQKHQDAFKRIGTRPPTGILMFGPPGCSKTLMARAVASEAGLNFLAVKGPELFSKWVGESEKAVRSVFAKARANAPSIIFFDEIDGLAVIRGKESDGISVSDRVMSQLLVELDGLHQRVDVTVIAATNRPDKIDSALLRPGRFDRLLYVGPPDETDREEIFKIHLRKIPCSSDVNLKELASLTEGFTGADISLICREAAIAAMEESLDAKEITMQHLKAAISHVEPTEVLSYEELSAKFQRLVHSNSRVQRAEHIKSIGRSFSVWTLIGSIKTFLHRFMASRSESGS